MWPFLIPPPLQWSAAFRLRRTGTSVCWIFSCFHNQPNSDMGGLYRVFNVRAWSFVCVRIHTGVGSIPVCESLLLTLLSVLIGNISTRTDCSAGMTIDRSQLLVSVTYVIRHCFDWNAVPRLFLWVLTWLILTLLAWLVKSVSRVFLWLFDWYVLCY